MDNQPTSKADDWEFKARLLEIENDTLKKKLDILMKKLFLSEETISDIKKTNTDLTRIADDMSKHIVFLLGKMNAAGIKIEE